MDFEKAVQEACISFFFELELNYHDDQKTNLLTGSGCQDFDHHSPCRLFFRMKLRLPK
jgi:hypothetical protein